MIVMNTQFTNGLHEDDLLDDDLDEADFITSNRDRRAMQAARMRDKPKLTRLSDKTREVLKEAAASGVEADVFNPSFVCKFFERDWVIEYFGGFYDNNLIGDVIARVKGGKEANVYVCVARPHVGVELLAGKLYRPRMHRNLKNDAEYRAGGELVGQDGKALRKEREQRAVAKRTKVGLQMLHQSWLSNEYGALMTLHAAGALVPKPHSNSENAILMEYLGERGQPAQTLNHITLSGHDEARRLFDVVVDNIRLMLSKNVIHGDLSAYNIMYWSGEMRIIDFPQAVNPYRNPHAYKFFARDVERVCQYFEPYGIDAKHWQLSRALWKQVLRADADELKDIQRGRWTQ
jgi:RIO kinase 1